MKTWKLVTSISEVPVGSIIRLTGRSWAPDWRWEPCGVTNRGERDFSITRANDNTPSKLNFSYFGAQWHEIEIEIELEDPKPKTFTEEKAYLELI